MLSERQLEALLDVFRKRMQGVTEDYLTRMGEHLRDIGQLTPSDVNRIVELKRLNANMEQIKREIAKAARMSVDDIEKLFKAVAESDLRFANTVYASDHEPTVKANKAIERILKAQSKITKQELANLSQTTLLSDGYREAIDVAVQTVQGGVTDYGAAIRRAMKSAASEGLRVRYPNSGLTRRLDSAVRMNVLDGVRAVNQDIMRQVGKEFKADGIELSAHNLCAEDHLPYQGTQMSIKDFERLQNRLDRPFGMWNCHHSWHYIILGVSKPAYSPEELDEFKRNSREEITIDGVTKTRYEWTQEQRKIETAIRYQKDIAVAAKASGDMVARRECQYIINNLWKRYDKVTEAAKLREKPERTRVEGFSAVKAVDQLKNVTNTGIMQMYRKTTNTGAFAILPERMSKKHVRQVAKTVGIDLKGITIFIDTDEEKLKDNFMIVGRADHQTIGRIEMFPKAFSSKEELIRTLYHESLHVQQFKEHGVQNVQANRVYFENITDEAEDAFIERLKKEGLL